MSMQKKRCRIRRCAASIPHEYAVDDLVVKVSRHQKSQAIVEFLSTYGIALMVLLVMVYLLLEYLFLPDAVPTSWCTLAESQPQFSCTDIVIATNQLSKATSVYLYLQNGGFNPVANVIGIINLNGYNSSPATCAAGTVSSGGAVICDIPLSNAISGTRDLLSGYIYINLTECDLLSNYSMVLQNCGGPTTTTIFGTFATHNQYKVPKITTTSTSSTSTVSTTSTSVTTTTTTTIGVLSYTYVFQAPSAIGANGNALVIDGVEYDGTQLPLSLQLPIGGINTYAYNSVIAGPANTQYGYIGISGCGLSQQSGTFTATASCTATASYNTQYWLNMAVSPVGWGTVSPLSEWVISGNNVIISETRIHPHNANGWTGTGAGSYSGGLSSTTITVDNPITEQANFR